jgi:glucose/arabinose dehydrogenase
MRSAVVGRSFRRAVERGRRPALVIAAVLISGIGGVRGQGRIQTLPIGAGAIGKGPTAIVMPGYEDAPRPPAFDAKMRALVAELDRAVDTYTPHPAWAGQTRAPKPAKIAAYEVETFAEGLTNPWSLNFLPDGRALVSEMRGGLRIIDKRGHLGPPITAGLPVDFSKRAQFLLDSVPDHDFARNRVIYFVFRKPPKEAGDIGQREEDFPLHYPDLEWAGRGRLAEDEKSVTDFKVLLNTQGIDGRLIQAPDGTLFIDSGPLAGRGINSRDWTQSQLPGSLMGKVLHINNDGSIPADNPFIGRADTRPEIWAFGVRDAQGMAFDPQGRLWTAESGPMGGDEVNLIVKGKNYGFPVISYGREYTGEWINGGLTAKPGMEQPVYFWTPSVAPSGMTFYTGALFPEWRGDLFIATMSPMFGRKVIRLALKQTPQGMRVAGEEFLLEQLNGTRFRDVKQGPDGALYCMTDGRPTVTAGDKILRLVPRRKTANP